MSERRQSNIDSYLQPALEIERLDGHSSVVESHANSALPLTALFVLWIFLHFVPTPFPPLAIPVVGSPRLQPSDLFCKRFIREPLVFSKAPRQTDRAAVNRARGGGGADQWKASLGSNNVTQLCAPPLLMCIEKDGRRGEVTAAKCASRGMMASTKRVSEIVSLERRAMGLSSARFAQVSFT